MGLLLDQLNGSNGFRLRGIDAGDLSGWYVNHAGDVNADGIDDIIIGARLGNSSGRFDAGEAYVVYGSASGFAADFDLAALDGTNGFQINGIDVGDQAGRSVSAAGDVNGDGIDDIIIGAWQADADGIRDAGESYVVFGSAGGPGAAVELSALDGTNGFRIDGGGSKFFTGYAVSAAGDVNGDGIDDVIVGAWAADVGALNKAGQAYVVFGSSAGFAADINLSDLDGTIGFTLDGFAADASAGYWVADAGDVNGDGIDDIILSAFTATANGQAEAGQSYVIFGSASGFAAHLSLDTLDGSNGFVLNGEGAGDRSGYSVSAAGDVNGDGIDDVIIGSRWVDVGAAADVGKAYVVYGRTGGFSASIDLGGLDGTDGFAIVGVAAGDWTGASVAGAGDVNGDGIDDMVIGAYLADPGGVTDAGSTFVVYGRAGGPGAAVDLATLDASQGFRIDGTQANAHSGRFVDAAGDMNADGYADIVIGAYQFDQGSAGDAGESYVVYGFATPSGVPVAEDGSAAGLEDTPIAGQATATDPDGDALVFSLVTGPAHGSVSLAADGSFVYAPDADFFGADAFTFAAADGNGGSDTGTITLSVAGVQDAPVAQADSYATQINTPLAVSSSQGVLANDNDADGDSLIATLLTGPAHGTLALAVDGSFTYTPAQGFSGSDSFQYRTFDGQAADTAWVDISVTGAAPPPVLVALSFAGNAVVRTAVYSEAGIDLETVALKYNFNNLSVGSSGIFVSADVAAPASAQLSMLGTGLSARASDDSAPERRVVEGTETIRFDLVEDGRLTDALTFGATFNAVSGTGQVSLAFYDNGTLVETALADIAAGAISHDLAGTLDFDAVVMGATGSLAYAIDDVSFLRQSTPPAPPIGATGRVVTLDFTAGAGGNTHAAYAEEGVVLDTANVGYFADAIGLFGGSVLLEVASGTGDPVKLSTLGQGLGVRSYGSADDVTSSAERRTLDDAEKIVLTLTDTPELGDANLIAFDFAKATGAGQLLIDFYDDGVLVEQAAIDVLSTSVTHDLAGSTDFDLAVIGVSGSIQLDIAEITLVRDEFLSS